MNVSMYSFDESDFATASGESDYLVFKYLGAMNNNMKID